VDSDSTARGATTTDDDLDMRRALEAISAAWDSPLAVAERLVDLLREGASLSS